MTLNNTYNTLKLTLDKTCNRIVESNDTIFYKHLKEDIFLHAPENGVLKMSLYPSGATSFVPELALSLGLSCVRSEASGLTIFELKGD
jgi:hypothetical protein